MNFVDVLNDLIIESGLTKRQTALKIGVTTSQMTSYLRGAVPTLNVIVRFSNYFDCSINFLMGIDENKHDTKVTNKGYEIEHLLERYQKVLNQNKITHWKLCQKLEISESNIRGWKKGATPKIDTLSKICEYLNCSIDYLVGRAKE